LGTVSQLARAADAHELIIDIGGIPVLIRTLSPEFVRLLEERYGRFVNADTTNPMFEFYVELAQPPTCNPDEDVRVRLESGRWVMERGDFHAQWDPKRRRGWICQRANPHSIDSVLRIVHSLILAREGGFLVHGASAVRNGRAFLFAGASGVGKTTIIRLAPPDAVLLTDEISYLRPRDPGYEAFGTPFAGEVAGIGENVRAPLAEVYLLAHGRENRIEPISDAEATRVMLQNILFFAPDLELVGLIFRSVFELVRRVPVRRLVFAPDARVWELIV